MKVQAQTELHPVGSISPLPLSMVIPILSSERNIQKKMYLPWARATSRYWKAHGPLQWCFSQVKTTLQVPDQGGRDICQVAVLGFYNRTQPCFVPCAIMMFSRSELLSLSCNSTDMTALTLSSGSFHIKGGILLRTRADQHTFISPKGIAG